MRSNVDPQKIEQLVEALGREARGSGCIYFTGGVSALLIKLASSILIFNSCFSLAIAWKIPDGSGSSRISTSTVEPRQLYQ